ncbi:CD225/dispanin family protein [Arenimonas sp.]|uniref:CD225/dispanin family protein n=1 Tax=Arenimonas sp. TaxID=1872635 RepID=UPI0039E7080A
MYCQHCGHQNPDGASVCEACGHAPTPFASSDATPPPVPPPPSQSLGLAPDTVPNYLVWSILATLCCCVPGGIVAIVYSSQVNTKLAVGDLAGAIEASNNAKLWCWVSLGVGLVVGVLYFLLNIFAAAAGQGY